MSDKPWFRPKRIGWGYTPQTWQGWLITALLAVIIVVLVGLVAH